MYRYVYIFMYTINWPIVCMRALYKEGLVNILLQIYLYIYIAKDKRFVEYKLLMVLEMSTYGHRNWHRLLIRSSFYIYRLCYAPVCESSFIIILITSKTFRWFKWLSQWWWLFINNVNDVCDVCVCVQPEHMYQGEQCTS